MGMTAEIHIKFIGSVSTLFAFGLIVASAVFLARILRDYDNMKSHPESLDTSTSSEEAPSMYWDIPESRPMKYFSDGVEKKHVDQPRSPEQNKTDNRRIETAFPGVTNEFSGKEDIKLDDFLHFAKNIKNVTSIRPPHTRKNRIKTARVVSTLPKRVNSLKPLFSNDDDPTITSDYNSKLRLSFPDVEKKWESEKIIVDSILDSLNKRAPVVKRDVYSSSNHNHANHQLLLNKKILTNCPSSREYNFFVVLSSIGIVCGTLQVIAASLVCCASNKTTPGISTLLIVYNLSSCFVLIVIFGLTLAYGSCTRMRAERSEWLAFASLVGVDAAMLFFLICYGTYILANDNDTQLNDKRKINSDVPNFEEEDQLCYDAQRV